MPTVIHDEITHTGKLGEGAGNTRTPSALDGLWELVAFSRAPRVLLPTGHRYNAWFPVDSIYPGSTAREHSLVHGDKPQE